MVLNKKSISPWFWTSWRPCGVTVITMLHNAISVSQMILFPIKMRGNLFCSESWHAAEQIVKRTVIWGTMALMWSYCNDNAAKRDFGITNDYVSNGCHDARVSSLMIMMQNAVSQTAQSRIGIGNFIMSGMIYCKWLGFQWDNLDVSLLLAMTCWTNSRLNGICDTITLMWRQCHGNTANMISEWQIETCSILS